MADQAKQTAGARRQGGRTPKKGSKSGQELSDAGQGQYLNGVVMAADDGTDTSSPSKAAVQPRRKKAPSSNNDTGHHQTRSKKVAPTEASRANPDALTDQAGLSAAAKQAVVASTPAKAYAGPNFHASPAASALPLPKFFSKSVPNVDKTVSLKHMVDNETGDAASESEGSPFESVGGAVIRQKREDSPLDMLFKADRAEKERKTQSEANLLAAGHQAASAAQYAPHRPASGQQLRDRQYQRASPSQASSNRHHDRHNTDGATGSMFSLEIDGQDHLEAQSQALKNLLQTPRSQGSSAPSGPPTSYSQYGSPSPRQPASRTSGRLAGTPPEFPRGLVHDASDQRHTTLLALAEKHIAPPQSQSHSPPPPPHNSPQATPLSHQPARRSASSALRRVVKPHQSPNDPSSYYHENTVPHTPTPARRTPAGGPSTSEHHHHQYHGISQPTAMAGNSRSSSLQDMPRPSVVAAGGSSEYTDPNVKTMENDLRRILKLG